MSNGSQTYRLGARPGARGPGTPAAITDPQRRQNNRVMFHGKPLPP